MIVKTKNTFAAFAVVAILVFFASAKQAHAAQAAQVIVPQANVYQYPQASSNVISRLNRGDSVTVSNLPTEGFYKVRLPNGDVGWVSGNDVLSGSVGSSNGDGRGSVVAKPVPPRARKRSRSEDGDAPTSGSSDTDSFRVLISYGIGSLSYGGLTDTFGSDNVKGLNLVKNFSAEAQFKINPKLFWAIKIDSLSADTGIITITSSETQEIAFKQVPVELGLVWSPISRHSFRWGVGLYLGAPLSSTSAVTLNNTVSAQQIIINYGAVEPIVELGTQFSWGLGDAFGIFLAANYRYDETSAEPSQVDSTRGITIPSFKINYSGVTVRLGIEIRI